MRTKPFQIGVTGGIGSGKSTVCQIFSILGVPCYNADIRARWLMENDQGLVDNIQAFFGTESYIDQKINRNFLAKQTFGSKSKLDKLNSFVHPKVKNDYEEWLEDQQQSSYVIKEAALLFESGSYKLLDAIVNVTAPIDLRVRRVLQRDSFRSESEIKSIIKRQLSEEERSDRSDYMVQNDESQSIISQVLELHNTFSKGELTHK